MNSFSDSSLDITISLVSYDIKLPINNLRKPLKELMVQFNVQNKLRRKVELAEKPTAAFVLSLIGGIFIIIGGVFGTIIGIIGSAFIGAFSWISPEAATLSGIILVYGILGLVFGIIVVIGAVMINSGERGKVRTGSILAIIFSILSLFFYGWGGFIIGFILSLIGGILGLTWKPSVEEAPPPPPV